MASSSANIVVVGSANTDLVVRVRSLPRPGETVIGGTFASVGGGKGANQAVAAARAVQCWQSCIFSEAQAARRQIYTPQTRKRTQPGSSPATTQQQPVKSKCNGYTVIFQE